MLKLLGGHTFLDEWLLSWLDWNWFFHVMEVRWGVTCYIGCKLVDSWDFVRLGVFPG
jgi:hypothetical protein